MEKAKKLIILSMLLMFVCVSLGYGQTSKRKRSRHGKSTKPSVTKTKSTVPAPTNLNSNAVTTESGLTYVITQQKDKEGRKPAIGETVLVHYTGTLTDGTKFDSSHDRSQPIAFKLGIGQVIKGWDEGIAKLGIGDQAILVIPPSLGYGERGAGGVIPPNATLIFIVELVEIKQ